MWEFPQQYGLWYPGLIATSLWLDAADATTVTTVSGAVSQWNDKSGNGANFTQETSVLRPELQSNIRNGLPAVYFNTTGTIVTPNRKYLTASFIYSGNQISCFSVHINNSGVNTASFYGRVFSFGDAGVADFSTTGGLILTYGVTSGISLYRNSATIASTSAVNNTWCLVDSERNAGTGRISLNGGTYTTGSTSTANQAITRFRIGSDFTAQGNPADSGLNGYIAENIVVTGALSDANRQRLQGYLAHKWGLTANLPAGHPYKTVGPTP
jgi:hypothetical protein